MDSDVAFRMLGLVRGMATRSDVDKAWRRAMRLAHPDKQSGDTERAQRLNTAHDQALLDAKPNPKKKRTTTTTANVQARWAAFEKRNYGARV